ncbi:hypothetical protein GCM10010193_70550 [Kitasatospora atroaurantiaca]|uniref:Uncharacterized protein n=1 Tax=Kitasatospora atroaurantiaca TaxID=285545 RepID=A0A561END9_9ACTN|nr:hypothetical protein [Kitasatospora atroaurantiaca]TWE17141.1 hypothetical protein FB465_2146 [Kitasatospora atroaurantiaca]
MTAVRTTIRPDLEVEVSPAEHLDLQRQGLLVEDPSASAGITPEPTRANPAASAAKED